MPCESCNVQFTVFKRKRLCTECRRFYCNHCLVKRSEKILCERCIVLTARPLSKIDLLKLKPKDLIFYLQSKHISTTGCVEKEELVNLVMTHVNATRTTPSTPSSNTSSPQRAAAPEDPPSASDFENCSNPFDQIKQTCQSLFNSFAEKIVDLNFENKPPNNTSTNQQTNIFNQPRFQTREMPTYASSTQSQNVQSQNLNIQNPMPRSSSSTSELNNVTTTAVQMQSASSSNPSSPIVSIGSVSSHGSSSQQRNAPGSARTITQGHSATSIPSIHRSAVKKLIDNLQDVNTSGCECSDDEVLAEFTQRHKPRTDINTSNVYVEKLSPPSQSDSAFEDQIPGPSGSGAQSASPSKLSSGDNQRSSEESSGSSFEELGAVGGSNDWQIVDKADVIQPPTNGPDSNLQQSNTPSTSSATSTFQQHSSNFASGIENKKNNHKPRRLNRRRSDSCVVHTTSNRSQPETPIDAPMEDDESDDASHENPSCKRSRKCCHKCGKTKNSLKSKLLKFRRQLETQQMSEVEMKRAIEEFLNFLENKSKESLEGSDSEANATQMNFESRQASTVANVNSITVEDFSFGRDDDGIHVYGSREEESYGGPWRHDSRFLNLGDFKSSSEFDDLSVKQLKEILMLNRVDFKGCCEKQELLDRVNRLWNDLQTSPAVDKLPTDDLCKICMDAPIECVILECGHMATCTNCGKVLSECPICRQYIVRVVRFFRA